jgi:hypothetical protein
VGTPAQTGSITPPQFSDKGTWTAQSISGQMRRITAELSAPGNRMHFQQHAPLGPTPNRRSSPAMQRLDAIQ